MNKKHPKNKNLTIHDKVNFNCQELIPGFKYISQYLSSIETVMSKALQEHTRTLCIRFDLRLPDYFRCIDTPNPYREDIISRFFASLQAKFKADFIRRSRINKQVHSSTLRFVWCKEQHLSSNPHFHCAIFINASAYKALGVSKEGNNHIATRIVSAWCSALELDGFELGLVYFPEDRPVYRIDVNSKQFKQIYNDAFRRLSYLAKVNTKSFSQYGDSFGYSRK